MANKNCWQWWESKRCNYNKWLVLCGIIAFLCYAILVWSFHAKLPNVEITLFTIMVQSIGYLLVIGVANICYFVGPISEKIIKPDDVIMYRENSYALGKYFSAALPFCVPLITLLAIIGR